jgi:hypothetical protein
MTRKRRTPIRLTRKGTAMKNPFHDPKPTTNVASRERAAKRDATRDIRKDEAQMYNTARKWAKDRERGKDQGRDDE